MKVQKAASLMLGLLNERRPDVEMIRESYCGNATSLGHAKWMLMQIIIAKVKDEQAHRWLGWTQAVICFNDVAILDDMKAINFRS